MCEQEIRDQVRKLMVRSGLGVFNQSVYDKIEELELELQEVLGFKQDITRHCYKKLYEFKCLWVGRKFKCIRTGEELIIPDTITYGNFLKFGNCFIDVGDNYYSRWGGDIEEIKD